MSYLLSWQNVKMPGNYIIALHIHQFTDQPVVYRGSALLVKLPHQPVQLSLIQRYVSCLQTWQLFLQSPSIHTNVWILKLTWVYFIIWFVLRFSVQCGKLLAWPLQLSWRPRWRPSWFVLYPKPGRNPRCSHFALWGISLKKTYWKDFSSVS